MHPLGNSTMTSNMSKFSQGTKTTAGSPETSNKRTFSLNKVPLNPINIDLKIDIDIDLINQRYGIQPKEKLGDIIIETH